MEDRVDRSSSTTRPRYITTVVGHLGDDPQVVGDQHDRHPVALLEIEQQVEDLGLRRHVQRRRRLVGDQEPGIGGQRHRDHRPLPDRR